MNTRQITVTAAALVILSWVAWGQTAPSLVNDRQLIERLTSEAQRMMEAGELPRFEELRKQLNRGSCEVKLAPAVRKRLAPEEVYARDADSVMVLGELYHCTHCLKWHAATSGAYVISESGVAVTCYHVFESTNTAVIIAMTRSGKIYPVKEVLAASAADDLALIQLGGSGFKPLGVSTDAPAGSKVMVLSHPNQHFFMFTEGLVARYNRVEQRRATRMNITADFAKGSSGCPVLNESGAVVGTVSSTESIYHSEHDAKQENLQMVIKDCTPSQALLSLVRAKSADRKKAGS